MSYVNSDVADIGARAESWNMHLLGHSDLAAHGDGSRIDKKGDYLFVAHMKSMAVTILNVADPKNPGVVNQIQKAPGVHSHKVQIVGDLMLTNHERAPWETGPYQPGLELYDISRPDSPKQISFFPTYDKGVHRFWFSDESTIGDSLTFLLLFPPPLRGRIKEGGRWCNRRCS